MSASTFCKAHPEDKAKIIEKTPQNQEESDIEVMISPVNNLPIDVCLRLDSAEQLAIIDFAEDMSATECSDHNVSEPLKELLCQHCGL